MNTTYTGRKARSRAMTLLAGLFSAGSALFIATGLMWRLGRTWISDSFLPMRTASAVAPFFLVGALPLLAIALIWRRWKTAAGLAILAALFLAYYWPVIGPRPSIPQLPPDGLHLRLMSYNIWSNNEDLPTLAAMINLHSPDLLAVQEVTHPPSLQRALQAQYPYSLHDQIARDGSQLLFSRYPLEVETKPEDVDRVVQRARMITPQGEIAVWNIHPNSALIRWWPDQHEVMSIIAGAIAQDDRPVILMGDFNQTDQHENYLLVAAVLTDMHWAVGRGFGFTYPNFRTRLGFGMQVDQMDLLGVLLEPVVRIDHILVSAHFIPLQENVVQVGINSDHYPVMADVYLIP